MLGITLTEHTEYRCKTSCDKQNIFILHYAFSWASGLRQIVLLKYKNDDEVFTLPRMSLPFKVACDIR